MLSYVPLLQKSIYQTWPHIGWFVVAKAATSKVEIERLLFQYYLLLSNQREPLRIEPSQTKPRNDQESYQQPTAASWACQHACATSKQFHA